MVGEYVRILSAPIAQLGTIISSKTEEGETKYLFHHDPRFNDDRMPDFWVTENDIQACARPADADVAKIKAAGA